MKIGDSGNPGTNSHSERGPLPSYKDSVLSTSINITSASTLSSRLSLHIHSFFSVSTDLHIRLSHSRTLHSLTELHQDAFEQPFRHRPVDQRLRG
jgi:hypothetical protein